MIAAIALMLAAQTSPAASAPTPPPVATPAPAASGHALVVAVEGVRSADGRIMAGLQRLDPGATAPVEVGGTVASAAAGTVSLRFENLPDGVYAVRVFHDADGDGRMKTNLFGMPTEGFGFSNRAVPRMGPPSFDAMKVEVKGADASTAATMTYMN